LSCWFEVLDEFFLKYFFLRKVLYFLAVFVIICLRRECRICGTSGLFMFFVKVNVRSVIVFVIRGFVCGLVLSKFGNEAFWVNMFSNSWNECVIFGLGLWFCHSGRVFGEHLMPMQEFER
jgi:hypothetical protein